MNITAQQTKPEASERVLPRLAYSIDETANMLGVSYHSIYRLIQRGKIRATQNDLLRIRLVPASEVKRLLEGAE